MERKLNNFLRNERCAIITRSGVLLWRSPCWGQKPNSEHLVAGKRWHEFVHTEDLEQLLDWFSREGRELWSFRMMRPSSASWVMLTFAKVAIGDDWLVFCDLYRIDYQLPAPACLGPVEKPCEKNIPNRTCPCHEQGLTCWGGA